MAACPALPRTASGSGCTPRWAGTACSTRLGALKGYIGGLFVLFGSRGGSLHGRPAGRTRGRAGRLQWCKSRLASGVQRYRLACASAARVGRCCTFAADQAVTAGAPPPPPACAVHAWRRERAWCCCARAACQLAPLWRSTWESSTRPGGGLSGTPAPVSGACARRAAALPMPALPAHLPACSAACPACVPAPARAASPMPAAPCPAPPPAAGRGAVASSKRNLLRLGASDEFFNIAMERPAADVHGFDVMFVNVRQEGCCTCRAVSLCRRLPAPAPPPAKLRRGGICQRPVCQPPLAPDSWRCLPPLRGVRRRPPTRATSPAGCATAASPTARRCPWWREGASPLVGVGVWLGG